MSRLESVDIKMAQYLRELEASLKYGKHVDYIQFVTFRKTLDELISKNKELATENQALRGDADFWKCQSDQLAQQLISTKRQLAETQVRLNQSQSSGA